MQCVARNHVQYEQAIYGWFKANWKSCPSAARRLRFYMPGDMR